ncbi:glutathione synthase [Candidatus Marinamargulisbacteria bacterium SCGC AG-343-D04]|nr:glutathione synthase [Candidatus Marinamargulisbacteria bacterium SCGC AG-343-D04]
MNILFLMKGLETIIPEKDTSLLFMQEAQRRGHTVYFLPQGGCSLTPTGALFHVKRCLCVDKGSFPLDVLDEEVLSESDVDVVFIRTDPPFDTAYLTDMWVLEQLSSKIRCINTPLGIRTVNEKIWITQFKDLIPPTLLSSSKKEILSFIEEHQHVIVKPCDGFGGDSIFTVMNNDLNKQVILEMMTQHFTQYCVIQSYISESKVGDKRILLCNGEILGAVLRVHSAEDHRNNFFAGGTAQFAEITDRDRHVVSVLKPHLSRLGLSFVGIDIIGDFLIECNVTSPTCLKEMSHVMNKSLERVAFDYFFL